MIFSCCEGAIHQRFLKVTYCIRRTKYLWESEVVADLNLLSVLLKLGGKWRRVKLVTLSTTSTARYREDKEREKFFYVEIGNRTKIFHHA